MSDRPQKSWGQLGPIGKAVRYMTEDVIRHPERMDTSSPRFGTYRKRSLTTARQLTEADQDRMNGHLEVGSLEESHPAFRAGDYEAQDSPTNHWVIRRSAMEATKEQVGEPDPDGWTKWRAKTTIRATELQRPTRVRVPGSKPPQYLHAKRHDELGLEHVPDENGGSRLSVRVIDKQIFADTYAQEPSGDKK